MNSAAQVLPWLSDRGSAFLCKDLEQKNSSQHLYRVPIDHRKLGNPGALSDDAFKDWPANPTLGQLRAVLFDSGGLGLFVPQLWSSDEDTAEGRAHLASIIILPPEVWPEVHDHFAGWQFDGVEKAFADLPYRFEDILIFAKINFSPDCWYVVKQGPMAGKIFLWCHDGESAMDMPWAADLVDWGNRLLLEMPDILGGIIRFDSEDTDEECPSTAELFPEKFVSAYPI